MEAGEIIGQSDARAVFEAYSRFNGKHKLKNFRVRVKNLAKELGIERNAKGKLFHQVFLCMYRMTSN